MQREKLSSSQQEPPSLQRQRAMSAPMSFPSMLNALQPFAAQNQRQLINMMDDLMGGAFETLDPFTIRMHRDHTEGVPQQILNFPMGASLSRANADLIALDVDDETRRDAILTFRFSFTDVIMKKDKYLIHADLPGLSMKDVTVEVEDVDEMTKILHITARREHRSEEQDQDESGKWVAYERFYGKMDRSFPLPKDVALDAGNDQAIQCRLVNGELTISIKRQPPPEKEKAPPRMKIPIIDH